MEIVGLPLHPLVVHAAVVLVPLGALGALAVVIFPKVRSRYGWLILGVATAGLLSAIVARLSGPGFAEYLGLAGSVRIAAHQAYGMWAAWPVLVLVIALALFLAADLRRDRARATAIRTVSAILTLLAALASLVLIGLTGHAGATAAWGP